MCIIEWSASVCVYFFFFKQKTAYELRISDWSSDVCSSYLNGRSHHDCWHIGPVRLFRTSSSRDRPPPHGLRPDGQQRRLPESRSTSASHGWAEIGRASCGERVCPYV